MSKAKLAPPYSDDKNHVSRLEILEQELHDNKKTLTNFRASWEAFYLAIRKIGELEREIQQYKSKHYQGSSQSDNGPDTGGHDGSGAG